MKTWQVSIGRTPQAEGNSAEVFHCEISDAQRAYSGRHVGRLIRVDYSAEWPLATRLTGAQIRLLVR